MNADARKAHIRALQNQISAAEKKLNSLVEANALMTEYEQAHVAAFGGLPPRVGTRLGFYYIKNSNGQDGAVLTEHDIRTRTEICKKVLDKSKVA